MPSRHTIRSYSENGIYHIYNRGVDRRITFQDSQDYTLFLHYLKKYLTPPKEDEVRPQNILRLCTEVDLLAYCLMPNHFHLLIKQTTKDAITTFMRCVMNAYTKYFNKKYDRVGTIFQGKFKAALIDQDQYLLHLSRYIHLNPLRSDLSSVKTYPYSIYLDYLEERTTVWVKPASILSYFKTARDAFFKETFSYQSFVENYAVPPEEFLGSLVIEEE